MICLIHRSLVEPAFVPFFQCQGLAAFHLMWFVQALIMHLQDARCMNSFSNRSAGKGLYCIVQLCSIKGRRGDKGKVIGLRSERSWLFSEHHSNQSWLRACWGWWVLHQQFLLEKKLLPNLPFVPMEDTEFHTQMTVQKAQDNRLFSYLIWCTSRYISYS